MVERLWRSVKYEDVYLRDYETPAEARLGLARYFAYYNHLRRHSSLGRRTPASVYGLERTPAAERLLAMPSEMSMIEIPGLRPVAWLGEEVNMRGDGCSIAAAAVASAPLRYDDPPPLRLPLQIATLTLTQDFLSHLIKEKEHPYDARISCSIGDRRDLRALPCFGGWDRVFQHGKPRNHCGRCVLGACIDRAGDENPREIRRISEDADVCRRHRYA